MVQAETVIRGYQCSFFTAWYDGWIGYFYARKAKRLYLIAFPGCVLCIQKHNNKTMKEEDYK
jgi:hypothetical protein